MLYNLKVGAFYHLRGFTKECSRAQRDYFISLGLIPGSVLEVLHRGPFGRIWEIYVQTRFLALPQGDVAFLDLEETALKPEE